LNRNNIELQATEINQYNCAYTYIVVMYRKVVLFTVHTSIFITIINFFISFSFLHYNDNNNQLI